MSVSNSAKKKIQAAPKEIFRRGLLTGTEKLHGQLRDAAEGGQRQDTEVECAQDSARSAVRQTGNRMKKLAHGKGKGRTGKAESRADADGTGPDVPTQDIHTEQGGLSYNVKPVQIKSKAAFHQSASAEYRHTDLAGFEPFQAKTKNVRSPLQVTISETEPAAKNTVQSECQAHNSSQQGRQKFTQKRQKNAVEQRMEKQRGPERTAPARQRDVGNARLQRIPALSAQNRNRYAESVAREAIPNSKRQIKGVQSGAKAVGRSSHQATKGPELPRKGLQTGGRYAQSMRQTAQAANRAQQRVVQAAGTVTRTAAVTGRPVSKAATDALRGAVSSIRALIIPLAVGGGAVFAVVLVLCLVGALLASPLGIFFSGGNSGGQQQQQTTTTISAVVRELNQEYNVRLDEIRASVSYDEESLTGSRAPWAEILAVYAVKTASDLTNGQEVVTMTAQKKALLKQVFWAMNQFSSFTSTVPGEDGGESTTTLYITITARAAGEMADVYGFNADQRRQLAELLSDGHREMWNNMI